MGYSDSLEYLPSDIATISEEVTEGLVASGSFHEKSSVLAGRQVELWQDIALQHGKARQMAFSRALRAELQRIFDAADSVAVRPSKTPLKTKEREESDVKSARSASAYMQPLPQSQPTPEDPKEDVSLRHVDVQKEDRFASNPWMGAGIELHLGCKGMAM